MIKYEYISPCHFGLEAVLKREIKDLGYEITNVDNGKVTYTGDINLCARANMFLRTTERVLLKVASFKAETFDELFESTKAIPWEEYIPSDGRFWVAKANSINSKLFSPSDIQSIMKKAIVERMKKKYKIEWFEESGSAYPLRVTIIKDEVTVCIDTSGESLHRRGYRKLISKAPITETLAAALIMLTPWNKDRILVDPFCGSGTIPIEAALIGAKIAPGINRSFLAESWKGFFPDKIWKEARDEARDLQLKDIDMNIQGYDIDGEIVKAARQNARMAGVDHLIHFQQKDLSSLSSSKKYGFIITNPPYGERLEEQKNLPGLYKEIGKVFGSLDAWSYYIITGYENAEKYIGRKADRNRKVYNGMMKTYFYQFMGPKPPKAKSIN
ncbi:THUMP domain-containing class I SAM-dependent RNA methyltransferase [Herbinix luporum]|jgi:putative N6-adenine-specific DNA methylase|uniref:Putative RNA methyltransferase YpsC n=1 Tax=Herbinix luporum TaxID=1679721 RepID=A0A0K8J8D2_9FIRM|nr:class I SAM-dependent RNA methyltransferase [Herbinix luporum]CUH93679.1 putative RNA methyltransferase YpsC [Herbinix luporum]HHT56946.1 class I SAM-dependent RNA methyltransferase [Herbinix luporum]